MTSTSGVPLGVNPASLRPGSLIDVETRSEYCLTPVPAHLLQLGMIERGKKVMFFLNGNRPLTTSRVLSVHVDQPKTVQPGSSSSIH
jgi:hypothetical protein